MTEHTPRSSWREIVFRRLAGLAIHHRKWVWMAVIALSITAAATLPYFTMRTTRQGTHPPDLPEQMRYEKFQENFGTATQLVVLLEGDPAALPAAGDAIAAALSQNDQFVRNVFYKVDLAFFEQKGLYYLPLPELKKIAGGIEQYTPLIESMLAAESLPAALDQLAVLQEQAGSFDLNKAATGLSMMAPFLQAWHQALTEPNAEPGPLINRDKLTALLPVPDNPLIAAGGYLIGQDGHSLQMMVQQAETTDDAAYIRPFMDYCRATVADVLADHPGVTAGFTGWPVAVEEEVSMMTRDLTVVALASTVVILLLLYFSFRSVTKTLLVFVPLIFGVLWNTGLTYLTVGYLSYFTSVFFGLLFSLGTEYGIIFVRRFREEVVAGHPAPIALERTFLGAGPGIVTSALTTTAAFVAIALLDIPAFSQMGIVSATGMLCLLAVTMFILPPLLMTFADTIIAQAHVPVVGGRAVAWFWRGISARPWFLLGPGLVALLASWVLLPFVHFDYNVNNLLPPDSETVSVVAKLEKAMGHQTQYIGVVADNIDQVRRLHTALESAPTVGHVESPASILPPNQKEKQELLSALHDKFITWPIAKAGHVSDPRALIARLAQTRNEMAVFQEAAFAEGKTELLAALGDVLEPLESIIEALGSPEAAERQAAFEQALVDQINQSRQTFLTMLAQPPMTVDSLPDDLRRRFVGQTGQLAVMVFPSEPIWDPSFLERFVGEVTTIAQGEFGKSEGLERTAGFGVVYRITSHMISGGFRQALLMTTLIVFAILWFDFRRPRPALLASLPFLVAMSLTLGMTVIIREPLNMASQLALPVLVGIGVDFGVHTVHRWLEPDGVDLSRVVNTLGGTIWLAGATNMVGFGALLAARYRGLSTFGLMLFVGIFLAFNGAIFGLPALIDKLRLDPRRPK